MREKYLIRFCYRKIIDASATTNWDKAVFDSTYAEYQLQSQLYDTERKCSNFHQLLQVNPAAAKLHFLTSAAVIPYLQQLNAVIPDIQNNLGTLFLPFDNYQFEILQSTIGDRQKHRVAINFYSEPMIWHATIDRYMLVSKTMTSSSEELFPAMVAVQPFLQVYSMKKLDT